MNDTTKAVLACIPKIPLGARLDELAADIFGTDSREMRSAVLQAITAARRSGILVTRFLDEPDDDGQRRFAYGLEAVSWRLARYKLKGWSA